MTNNNKPLYKFKNYAPIVMSSTQESFRRLFIEKLKSGEYKAEKYLCPCQNYNDNNSVIISEMDRFGLPCNFIFCRNCGLIFTSEVLDEKSNNSFYENEYRKITEGEDSTSESLFNDHISRGREYFELLKKHIDINEIKDIFEVGCSTGGVLYPFHELGKHCEGADIGSRYLKYGVKAGMKLYNRECGDDFPENNKYDLLILSHVLEHIKDPFSILDVCMNKLRVGGGSLG